MANNSLDSMRIKAMEDKIATINRKQKIQRQAKATAAVQYGLPIIASIVILALAAYALMTREAVALFKLALVLEVIAAVGIFIGFCVCAGKASDSLTWVCFILAIVHIVCSVVMMTRGRFKIEEVITTNDGYVLEMIDGEYYIYSCNTKDDEIVISELPHNVVGFSSDFQGSNYITSIVIDVDRFELGKNAFSKCPALETVIFEGDGEYVIRSKAFNNCKRLTTVRFEEGNYSFKGGRVFANCSRLTDIYFGNGTFTGKKLTSILGGLKKIAVHIDNATLVNMGMNGAKELTLVVYDGVTSIGNIKPDVLVFQEGFDFYNWVDTRSNGTTKPIAPVIYLPTSVSSIPERMFGNDSKSYHVYYQGSAASWSNVYVEGTGGWIFGSNSNYSRNLTTMHYNSSCKQWETNFGEVGY